MSKMFTVRVDATFCFDVRADCEEEAKGIGRRLLETVDPVSDYGGFGNGYQGCWIAPARQDEGFPSLEAEEVE